MNAAAAKSPGQPSHTESRWIAQHANEPDGSVIRGLITYTCIACSKSLTMQADAKPAFVSLLLVCHEQCCQGERIPQ